MLKALGRKLNCLNSEDALTASVFGFVRYLPRGVLVEWLLQAQLASHRAEEVDAPWSRLPQLSDAHFWPQFDDTLKRHGRVEPDVLLEFGHMVIIVEAKLSSGKTPAAMMGEFGEKQNADQLARQVKAIFDFYGHRKRGDVEIPAIVYLTADSTPPARELAESAKAIERLGLRTPPPLYWLSWSALGLILEREVARAEFPGHLIAEDLLEYLREADVLRFWGWRLGESDGLLPREDELSCGWTYHAQVQKYFNSISLEEPRLAWTYRQIKEGER